MIVTMTPTMTPTMTSVAEGVGEPDSGMPALRHALRDQFEQTPAEQHTDAGADQARMTAWMSTLANTCNGEAPTERSSA